ncbi:UNVERIFIED_CONTAM: hypothetical protein K2H54_054254 [Gekko kuhli]
MQDGFARQLWFCIFVGRKRFPMRQHLSCCCAALALPSQGVPWFSSCGQGKGRSLSLSLSLCIHEAAESVTARLTASALSQTSCLGGRGGAGSPLPPVCRAKPS